MTIEAINTDGGRFHIEGETGIALAPSLRCGNGVNTRFPISGELIKAIEMEDWASRPDNEDIGGTIALVLARPRMDAVNGDLSHKETWNELAETKTIFDIKKGGTVEYEDDFGFGLKEAISFKHSTE